MRKEGSNHIISVTLLIYCTVVITVSTVFYSMLPLILNYPEGTVGGTFQKELEGITYPVQYAGITLSILIVVCLIIFFNLRKLLSKDNDTNTIRKIYLEAPNKIYTYIICSASILIVIIHAASIKSISITTLKIWIFFFSSITISCALAYILTKGIFTKESAKLNLPNKMDVKRVGIRKEVYMQTIPIFMSAILFTALVGYTRIVNEKGEVLSKLYLERLSYNISKLEFNSKKEVTEQLKNIKLESNEDKIFIYNAREKQAEGIDSAGVLFSEYFKKYLIEKSEESNRVYDYYGVDVQGVAQKITIKGETYFIGVIFPVNSRQALNFLIFTFIGSFLTNIIVIRVFAKTLSEDIILVTNKLNELSENEGVNLDKKLPITSNNEIGDLIIAFNKILDLEKEQINEIKQSQNILMEQERLVTLGQLAGGMAHDINTPLSSIGTGIDYFAKRIEKDENSELMINAVRKSIAKISSIVNSVRDQIRNLGTERYEKFSLIKVINNIQVLLFTETKKNNCEIKIENKDDIILEGDIGKLEQVITNIVLNSIQAYEGKGGVINIEFYKEEKNAIIKVSDKAGGIPPNIAESLLKQIVSTKGSRGTGFGLYFSNSIIKGLFKGEIKFETEQGVGTTFYVILPTYE